MRLDGGLTELQMETAMGETLLVGPAPLMENGMGSGLVYQTLATAKDDLKARWTVMKTVFLTVSMRMGHSMGNLKEPVTENALGEPLEIARAQPCCLPWGIMWDWALD